MASIKSRYPEYQAHSVTASLKKEHAAARNNGLPFAGKCGAEHYDYEKGDKVGVPVPLSPQALDMHNGQAHNTGVMYFPVEAVDNVDVADPALTKEIPES